MQKIGYLKENKIIYLIQDDEVSYFTDEETKRNGVEPIQL